MNPTTKNVLTYGGTFIAGFGSGYLTRSLLQTEKRTLTAADKIRATPAPVPAPAATNKTTN